MIGAGVAGLQAIATARRLGAVTLGVRPAAGRQGAGAEPRRPLCRAAVEAKDAQDARGYADAAGRVLLPTAARTPGPGRGGERRRDHRRGDPGEEIAGAGDREMVEGMAPGSVIVDLAAERGGNCELTRRGERVVEHGVTIIGRFNLPARCLTTPARCTRETSLRSCSTL